MQSAGQDRFFAAVESALSTHRLRLGFQERAGDTPVILLGRHLRNQALSEALYPVLQTLEITLRNSIDANIAIFHHRPIWNEKLNALHVSATEVIGWISPEVQSLTLQVDRFPAVHQRGEEAYRRLLREATDE